MKINKLIICSLLLCFFLTLSFTCSAGWYDILKNTLFPVGSIKEQPVSLKRGEQVLLFDFNVEHRLVYEFSIRLNAFNANKNLADKKILEEAKKLKGLPVSFELEIINKKTGEVIVETIKPKIKVVNYNYGKYKFVHKTIGDGEYQVKLKLINYDVNAREAILSISALWKIIPKENFLLS